MANPTVTQTQKPANKTAPSVPAGTAAEKTARVRRTNREVVKDHLSLACAAINDHPTASVRARLLSIRDLTPAQRTTALEQTVGKAYREALEALKVAPAVGGSTVDRTSGLDL